VASKEDENKTSCVISALAASFCGSVNEEIILFENSILFLFELQRLCPTPSNPIANLVEGMNKHSSIDNMKSFNEWNAALWD